MQNEITFRLATKDDLVAIIEMLQDDILGASRENFSSTVSDKYSKAFENICSDTNQELMIIEVNNEIAGTFQISYIQYLTYEGGRRAQLESVRIHSKFRGKGIGKKMIEYVILRAKEKGCHLLQLTTDKQRGDAIRFYESAGFIATHAGMKLKL